MHIDWAVTFVGWVVGLVVGMTGMGGGLIMTPLMILFFGVAPSVAVGTDLIYSSITKIFGTWQHWRQKTIDLSIVKALAKGSVPGALLGVGILDVLRHVLKLNVFQHVVTQILGITYIAITVWMIWNSIANRRAKNTQLETASTAADAVKLRRRTTLLGWAAGTLVGMTSVGSGSLFMAFLLVMYPLPAKVLVGTDILQAVMVTGVAGLAHLASGNVNIPLALNLLVGSIPGILMGSRLGFKIPDVAVRICLLGLLMATGLQMLGFKI
jgi:uncharacterized membrane protein YfcA